MWVTKIISGGQTGVDLGALDFAIERNIPCGGWCPKDRINEAGKISSTYPLREASTANYEERTELNVMDSDGTLILINGEKMGSGTQATINFCDMHQRPYLIIDLSENEKVNKDMLENWIMQHNIKLLNVAGNRESTSPGIYRKSKYFLEKAFTGMTVT